jgi:hypothetical protein
LSPILLEAIINTALPRSRMDSLFQLPLAK